jgi:hypothetical protein
MMTCLSLENYVVLNRSPPATAGHFNVGHNISAENTYPKKMLDPTFLGLHLHLRQNSSRSLPTTAEDQTRPHAGEAAGNQDGAAAKNASIYPVTGTLAETSRYRPLRLLCRAHKQSGALSVPALRGRPLAPHASAAQPERRLHVGADDEAGRRMASRAAHPSSMA